MHHFLQMNITNQCSKVSDIRILSNISTVDHFNSIITVSLEFIRMIQSESAEENFFFRPLTMEELETSSVPTLL